MFIVCNLRVFYIVVFDIMKLNREDVIIEKVLELSGLFFYFFLIEINFFFEV